MWRQCWEHISFCPIQKNCVFLTSASPLTNYFGWAIFFSCHTSKQFLTPNLRLVEPWTNALKAVRTDTSTPRTTDLFWPNHRFESLLLMDGVGQRLKPLGQGKKCFSPSHMYTNLRHLHEWYIEGFLLSNALNPIKIFSKILQHIFNSQCPCQKCYQIDAFNELDLCCLLNN